MESRRRGCDEAEKGDGRVIYVEGKRKKMGQGV